MLRVGLTGELGSGKSTVARLLGARGAVMLSSDEMARALMQPGEPVYAAIVERFGPEVVAPGGALNRRELARLAFDLTHPRIEELNTLIHPPVIAAQQQWIAALARTEPHTVVVVESALLFTARPAVGSVPWRERFDCIVLVTAPEEQKIARFIERANPGHSSTAEERMALAADARQRLAHQRISPAQAAECMVIDNGGSFAALEMRVDALWPKLQELGRAAGVPPIAGC